MLKLGIIGAGGRMGQAIIDLASKDSGIVLSALVESSGSHIIGREVHKIRVIDDVKAALRTVDAMIDFTVPQLSAAHAELAAGSNIPLVVGTTGLMEQDLVRVRDAAKRVAIVQSPNMSLSANVLFEVAERVAALLPGYDAEVTEIHHNLKKDAPSGTAKRLAESVRRGRQKGRFVFGREGLVGERKADEIGIHAVRGGDVVGDHTVLFLGDGERIELVHRVTSRTAFAAGAIAAAKWAVGKPAGLYDMADVLGLAKADLRGKK